MNVFDEDLDDLSMGYYGLVYWLLENWMMVLWSSYFSIVVCWGIIFDRFVEVIL